MDDVTMNMIDGIETVEDAKDTMFYIVSGAKELEWVDIDEGMDAILEALNEYLVESAPVSTEVMVATMQILAVSYKVKELELDYD